MHIIKTNEKILVWMHRTGITQMQLAKEMNTTRQTLAQKMSSNVFSATDIMNLKRLGFKD